MFYQKISLIFISITCFFVTSCTVLPTIQYTTVKLIHKNHLDFLKFEKDCRNIAAKKEHSLWQTTENYEHFSKKYPSTIDSYFSFQNISPEYIQRAENYISNPPNPSSALNGMNKTYNRHQKEIPAYKEILQNEYFLGVRQKYLDEIDACLKSEYTEEEVNNYRNTPRPPAYIRIN